MPTCPCCGEYVEGRGRHDLTFCSEECHDRKHRQDDDDCRRRKRGHGPQWQPEGNPELAASLLHLRLVAGESAVADYCSEVLRRYGAT